MSTAWRIVAVTLLNLRTIPQRLGDSLVIVAGVAGVVAVLVSMLSMSAGFRRTIENSADPDRAIVVSRGAEAEIDSNFSRETAAAVLNAPGVARSATGKVLASAETLMVVPVKRSVDTADAFVTLRGVGSQAFEIRKEWQIVAGRMFRPAVNELLVGRAARSQFSGLDLGQKVRLSDGDWTIVGVFASNGSSHESSLLADAETVLSAYRANSFNSVTVTLATPESFQKLKDTLTANPALIVDVKRETEYFASLYRPFNRILSFVAYAVGGIMGLGAIFAALNTMYSAVSSRSTEIATLRAIGFGAGVVITSIFVEALLLAAAGALFGLGLAYLFFDGRAISGVADTIGNNPQLVYSITITSDVAVTGIVLALLVGFLGASFPAIRAARVAIAAGLRAA